MTPDITAAVRLAEKAKQRAKSGDGLTWRDTETMADAVLRLAAEQQWRPISEAPKDGTLNIASLIRRGKIWRISDAYFNGIAWYALNGDRVFEPTHWLPLPPAPEAPRE